MHSPLFIPSADALSLARFTQVGSRMIVGLLFVAMAIYLPGCSLLTRGNLPQESGGAPRAMVNGVPFHPQDELQCGPAALAMVLNWSGIDVQPGDLTPQVFSPGIKGSLQSALIGAARRHGRVAYPIAGSEALLAEIAAGHPVIVLVNLGFFWYPKWHYAVAIGYDQENREVILHSGLTAREHLRSRVFMNIWRRSDYWGLLVLPPDRLPASGEEAAWLAAVAGLERTDKGQTAAKAGYSVALQHWPRSFASWMGLGNSTYNLHDLDSAAEAFHQATLIEPDNGMAWNNLAHVQAEQGKQQQALAAARHAVELGGPLRARFEETLMEIEAKSQPSKADDRGVAIP